MAGFPPISIRQPVAFDLVDDPVEICGVGTGFEAVFEARVRDGNGNEIVHVTVNAGGTGIWDNYHAVLATGVPPTAQGTAEVYELSAKDGSEINKVVVPITFGRNLMDPYHGFAQYTVVSGDSLWAIAEHWYSDGNKWPILYEANRNQITDPNVIFIGQVLRIPQ